MKLQVIAKSTLTGAFKIIIRSQPVQSNTVRTPSPLERGGVRLLATLCVLLAFAHLPTHAQNTGIGIGIISPHESAILQIVSPENDKGVLFPSFTSGTVGGIQNPAEGLLIYRTDENTHYQYSAANGWQPMSHWLKNGNNIYNINSGNVGIGTTSPIDKLSVQTATSSYGFTHTDGTITVGSYVGGSSGGGWLGTKSNHNLNFFTNNSSSLMTILTNGNVGVGTITPYSKLHVFGALRVGVHPNGNGFVFEQNGTGHLDISYKIPTSVLSHIMTMQYTGNVGIGTTNPTVKFEVSGGRSVFGDGIRVDAGWSGIQGYASIGAYHIFDNTTGLIANGSGLARAGYFLGNVEINGTVSKTAGSFKIDHPLDPANKFLYHSFVESPDMMNVYNGNVTTDGSGFATVQLPDYFEALNKDFRYQLTVIGTFAQVIVEKEISNSAFVIKTDIPNVKVSWQVTGIRKDAYAEMYRIPNTVEKTEKERGKYLHPEIFGASEDLRIIPGERVPVKESDKNK